MLINTNVNIGIDVFYHAFTRLGTKVFYFFVNEGQSYSICILTKVVNIIMIIITKYSK
ncbi:protein of unknown function [Paenibacillus alvei]|uniref:Uncharacterized protein n=1 Tax=Paenibacillus alvei TaxID=44250 RepID=A0A383RKL2_PAEAL|nr:protein of unknown function [Paenibacillus alvei]